MSDSPNLRSSASLIIIQPLQSITADGFNYRTLLIQRNPTQRSFSAAHVFPGGNLEPDDHKCFPSLNRSAPNDTSGAPSHLQTALKVCAIRETFEEAGILVGISPGVNTPNSVLADFRQKLKERAAEFNRIVEHVQAHVPNTPKNQDEVFSFDGLSHYANILTPTVFTKRWDTHFYLAILPSQSEMIGGDEYSHVAAPDESETVSVIWLSPAEALKRSLLEPSEEGDSITLPPPQFYLLTDLARWKDYRQLMDHRNRVVCPFTPELVKLSSEGSINFAIVFPGDPLHPCSEDLCRNISADHKSFVHRIHVRNEPADIGSQPGKFFRPLQLQRFGIHHIFGNGWEDLN